ncbi:MAG: type II secretion system GspH family protein [Acidobacteria bacterium]|nr:type II secretion system GspH family protein [Acidobacteriota bacterium]
MDNHVQRYTFVDRGHGASRRVPAGGGSAQRGFTLVEALVVVALLGIILAVAIPNMQRARVRAHMLEQVNALRQATAIGRINAIKKGRQVVLGIPLGHPVTLTEWFDDNGDEIFQQGTEEVIARWRIPDDITVSEATEADHRLRNASGNKVVRFRRDGVVESAVTGDDTGLGALVLTDKPGNQLRISIAGGTGTTIVEMKDGSGAWTRKINYWRY